MSIKSIQIGQVGVSNNTPSWVYIETNDTYAVVTTVGYLSGASHEFVNSFLPNMMALVSTRSSQSIGVPPVLYLLQLQNSNGVWSLTAPAVDVPVPFIVPGNIQAGLSGTAGDFISFPPTAGKGSLIFKAVNNTGNTNTTVSNAAMGQASVISIPDPATATADFVLAPSALVSGNAVKASGTAGLVVDGGYAFHAGTTAAYAGGGTSNAFTVTGMASTWIVTAVILTSTNAVSIAKAVPGTNILTVTFSADPGANTTVSWIASTATV